MNYEIDYDIHPYIEKRGHTRSAPPPPSGRGSPGHRPPSDPARGSVHRWGRAERNRFPHTRNRMESNGSNNFCDTFGEILKKIVDLKPAVCV